MSDDTSPSQTHPGASKTSTHGEHAHSFAFGKTYLNCHIDKRHPTAVAELWDEALNSPWQDSAWKICFGRNFCNVQKIADSWVSPDSDQSN